jgi:hypothetical protein
MVCALASVSVFGWSLHRTYLVQVLPWTLRGEGLDPYNLASSSLSTLLHRLFIFEPQLNPHPAFGAPWFFAVLHPTLQLALLAPALLWSDTGVSTARRISLEWSALLLATLTLTPLPASYHFTVLILPIAVLCAHLVQERRRALLAIVIGLYLAVGYPGWNTSAVDGWRSLLHVKRLYALVLLTAVALYLMKKGRAVARVHQQGWWLAGGAVALTISIAAGLEHQHGLFDDYAYRLPLAKQMFLAADPIPSTDQIHSIAMLPTGYRMATIDGLSIRTSAGDGSTDQLSLTAASEQLWTETVGLHSILEPSLDSSASILDAESPALIANGAQLAFLRQIDGRKQLFVRDLAHPREPDRQLTPAISPWNLEEIAISPNESMIVSATRDKGDSRLYAVKGVDQLELIPAGEARYPAISPDGRWLAFSTLRKGYWNLALRDFSNGTIRRLTAAPCNQTEPAWLADSRTLLYSSDCGRALGFTAICKRRFIP